MTGVEIITLLGAANSALTLLAHAGLTLAEVAEMQRRAKAEGRESLSPQDLAALRADARAALDALGGAIAERGVEP